MSTLSSYTIQCAKCKRASKQESIMSYSIFGYPDLDFRPPSMLRETMGCWVDECPYCGYIHTKLDTPCDLSLEVILAAHHEIESGFDWGHFSDRLNSLIRDTLAHRLKKQNGCEEAAVRFLNSTFWEHFEALQFAKFGAMLAKLTDLQGAAEQFLRVAWFYDDESKEQEATHWRKIAIEHVEKMMNQPQTPVSEQMICILADMLRRVGDFKSVFQLDESQLDDDSFIQLIKYQKELSKNEDRRVHKINETSATLAEKYNGRGMYFSL